MKYLSRTRFSFVLAGTLTLFSGSAFGAFFQVQESSPKGAGIANAGAAAFAFEDASTVWYNPAGLTRLKGDQLVVGGHFLAPSTKFKNQGSTDVFGTPLVKPGFDPDGGDAGEDALVPNLYYSEALNDNLTFGIGLNVPFGLRTEYDDGWVGRYHALESEIETININLALGQKINDRVSIGYGVNYQLVEATLTNAVDFGTICFGSPLPLTPAICTGAGLTPQMADGEADITADTQSLGYNIGVLFDVGDNTRVGVAHRSAMRHGLSGDAKFEGTPALLAAGFVQQGVEADITFPATTSLSVHHQVNAKWAVMGDATQTRWGRLPELRIDFDLLPDQVVTLDLDDVWRYSAGATYKRNSRLTYRFGIAFDESPTPNAEVRTARLPDEDRTWLTFGVGYEKDDRLRFDFSYAYVKLDDADINNIAPALPATNENTTRGNLVGEYDADTSILAAQVNWKFQTR